MIWRAPAEHGSLSSLAGRGVERNFIGNQRVLPESQLMRASHVGMTYPVGHLMSIKPVLNVDRGYSAQAEGTGLKLEGRVVAVDEDHFVLENGAERVRLRHREIAGSLGMSGRGVKIIEDNYGGCKVLV